MNIKSIKTFAVAVVAIVTVAFFGGCNRGKENAETARTEETAEQQQAEENTEQAEMQIPHEIAVFIPDGYQFLKEVRGDLTKNGLEDRVLFVGKNVDAGGFEYLNANSIIIIFNMGDVPEHPVLQKLDFLGHCPFEMEECAVVIENGNLKFATTNPDMSSGHGGASWTFRYRDSDFELIGRNSYECLGDGECMVVNERISVNHLTKKRKIETLANADEFYTRVGGLENFRSRYNERWEDVIVDSLVKLSEIGNLTTVTGYQTQFARIVGSWTSEEIFWVESVGANVLSTIDISDDGTISILIYGRSVGKLVPRGENNFTATNMVYHIEGEEEPTDDVFLEYVPESDRLKIGESFYRRTSQEEIEQRG